MKRYVYLNGKLVDEGKASVSVFDRGLNYGDGLFETIRAYGGVPVFLKEHITRLKSGAKAIGIKPKALLKIEADIKSGAIERLLKKNGLASGSAYVKIIITRGIDRVGHLPPENPALTSIIITKPIDIDLIYKKQEKGIKVVFINGYSPVFAGIKSLNYLPNVLAKAEAQRMGADEGIFTGPDTSIKEGTSSNIFIVSGGKIKTPPLSGKPYSGVLPGVTRNYVIRLCGRLGLEVSEEPVFIKDIKKCSEAFVTSSIIEIAPLLKVDSMKIGDGRPGPVTRTLQREYGRLLK